MRGRPHRQRRVGAAFDGAQNETPVPLPVLNHKLKVRQVGQALGLDGVFFGIGDRGRGHPGVAGGDRRHSFR